jgi:hypothetical protein
MVMDAFYFFHTIYIGADVLGASIVPQLFLKKTPITFVSLTAQTNLEVI